MRNKVLSILQEINKLFKILIYDYKGILTDEIMQSNINFYQQVIPQRINDLILIINSIKTENKINDVESVDEAIKLFEIDEIQTDIEKALNNKTMSYNLINGDQNNTLELFNEIIDRLDSFASHLNLTIATGNVKKKNL